MTWFQWNGKDRSLIGLNPKENERRGCRKEEYKLLFEGFTSIEKQRSGKHIFYKACRCCQSFVVSFGRYLLTKNILSNKITHFTDGFFYTLVHIWLDLRTRLI